MGIWDSVIEIIINLELKDYVMFILGGASWDLIKTGTRSFILKPLVQAFEKLETNFENFDYTSLRLRFQDTEIVIYGLENLLTSKLGTTMPLIAEHYHNILKGDITPHTIFVPIRFDEISEEYVDYGEGDDFNLNEYKKLWGVFYDPFGYEQDVYDVTQNKLLSKKFK